MTKTVGQYLAAGLKARDDACESDLIALADIVVTGVETGWLHFWVDNYRPEAAGTPDAPWCTLRPLQGKVVGAGGVDVAEGVQPVTLTEEVVRNAVTVYVDSRVEGGMGLEEARRLVDGSYTDAVIADSILQFAIYGEELYG